MLLFFCLFIDFSFSLLLLLFFIFLFLISEILSNRKAPEIFEAHFFPAFKLSYF